MCPSESCRCVNAAIKTACEACGTEKPKLQGWKCVKCSTRNHRGVKLCRECKEPFETSKAFWMCGVCGEHNRVDELDDNSRCGHCGYDMAPLSHSEERIFELHEERVAHLRAQQESFDSISARDAEEQFGDPAAGAEGLPPELAQPASLDTPSVSKLASLPKIEPFQLKPPESKHSKLYRRRRPSSTRASPAVMAAAATGSPIAGEAIPPGPPGFDWMCRDPQCGRINAGDEESCMTCGRHIEPTEWECPQCAALNHLSRSRCFNCHAGIPAYWTCPACQATTSTYDKACRQCHEPRPAVEPRSACDVWAEERETDKGPGFRRNDWYCTACNGLNFSRRTECYQCGAPRSRDAKAFAGEGGLGDDGGAFPSQPAKRAPEQNNWICLQCQASNFRTRRTCWQCGSETTAAVSQAATEGDANTPRFEKEGFQDGAESKPAEGRMNLWKKTDDWMCAKCFTKNYRGKSECFKCGASRNLAVSVRRASVRKPVKL